MLFCPSISSKSRVNAFCIFSKFPPKKRKKRTSTMETMETTKKSLFFFKNERRQSSSLLLDTMVAQLYEYHFSNSYSSNIRKRRSLNADGNPGWTRYQSDEDSTPSRHRSAKRIPHLRWHLLIQIRKLFKKGKILLDVDHQSFTESVFDGIENLVSIVNAHDEFRRLLATLVTVQPSQPISKDGSATSLEPIVVVENPQASVSVKKSVRCPSAVSWLGKVFARNTRAYSKDYTDMVATRRGAKVFTALIPMDQTRPQLTFVRLREETKFLNDDTPTKFVVFIVGSSTSTHHLNYRELGRCICDMLSNPLFQRILFRVKNTESLLTGIDRLFDHSIVIPPGQLNEMSQLNTHRIRRALVMENVEAPKKHGHYHHLDHHETVIKIQRASILPIAYDPMRRTGKLFNGLMSDVKHRYRYYWSDFFDALHYKCVVSTVLIFFITFATAIGLGEILRSKTEGLMGLSETLVSMCVCGVIWGLFSGQPLIIQTKTAAFVIIEGGLFSFCYTHNLNFMIVRVWTGVWVLPITILMVAFEAPVLIRYVTRFTEEMIDTLISVVLIFESLSFLNETFTDNPLLDPKEYCRMNMSVEEAVNMDSQSLSGKLGLSFGPGSGETDADMIRSQAMSEVGSMIKLDNVSRKEKLQDFIEEWHNQPNTALLTLVLMISTFFVSLYLERLKQSSYFSHTIRKAIGNFSIPITIPLMTLAANFLFNATYIHKLDMPTTFSPTRPNLRGWFINPFDSNMDTQFPTWAIFASILPAILLTILLFVELELAEHELSLKERGLKKGSGFHLDLALSGILIFICGFFGIPWLGAGCVESFSHANALTINRKSSGFERGDSKVERVVEQRVTTILVALLQGACAFFGRYLRNIPVAVLMGIFVHLSVTNLTLIEFVHRIVLYIVPRKYYPDLNYCQKVSTWRMHIFTTIQLICFASLFGVEVVAKISILFPMIVGLIALIRQMVLPQIFTNEELRVLDSEGDIEDEEEGHDETIRRKSLST